MFVKFSFQLPTELNQQIKKPLLNNIRFQSWDFVLLLMGLTLYNRLIHITFVSRRYDTIEIPIDYFFFSDQGSLYMH